MQIRLLGPIDVELDGVEVSPGGPARGALLALLAINVGRFVSAERLADQLWGDEPPPGASQTLRANVSKVRAILRRGGLDIRGGRDGYALDAAPEVVDSIHFEQLFREASTQASELRPRRALALVEAASRLWRGTPFGLAAAVPALAAESERLEVIRVDALELRYRLSLDLGQSDELIPELEELVRVQPHRERAWELLMLALYRAGRQADALAAFHRARSVLDEELGVEPGPDLAALQLAILRHEVPRPAALPATSLPVPVSSFTGREREIAAVVRLLAAERLVTLTGMGGVGKTRLALAVAQAASTGPEARFEAGATFVDLAPITDPDRIPAEVAAAFGIERQGASSIATLADELAGPERLLVLDNCEHLREAAGRLALDLLPRANRLRILATSREPLGVPGEVEVPVDPLQLPGPDADIDDIRASEAVSLFLARARGLRPDLAADADALRAAAGICAELDGLPLAIELAAARVKAFSLAEIREHLESRFRFLVAWRRLGPARHRTLQEALDWSFGLLSPDEQSLLASLSVFRGGFTLESVAAVCLDGDADRATDLLQRMVESSLVAHQETVTGDRYRLLETVRAYARLQLESAGRAADLDRAHAASFRALVHRAWVPIRLEGGEWIERLDAEHDNLRAALTWTRDAGETTAPLELAEGLWWFWSVHGDIAEGRAWLTAALGRAPDVPPGLRALALFGASNLAWIAGELDEAFELAAEAQVLLAAQDEVDTPGGPEPAARFESGALETMGLVALSRNDAAGATVHLEAAKRLIASLPESSPWRAENLAVNALDLGTVALADGRPIEAHADFEAAEAIWLGLESEVGVVLADLHLAFVAIERQRLDGVRAMLAEAIEMMHGMHHIQFGLDALDAVAFLASAQAQHEHAAECLHAATALRERYGYRAHGWIERRRLALHAALAAQQSTGSERPAGSEGVGQRWTFDRAMAVARAALSDLPEG